VKIVKSCYTAGIIGQPGLAKFGSRKFLSLCYQFMVPDYPHKTFGDKRSNYCLLMEALAMEAIPQATEGE
jgi:hypothetical protein